ncbi:MAG: RnfABCDGE type electron transport complex subunit D [Candidatus Micrarchaeaceae archaeon]|jgi:Na+-translocating ferredoxin:NAD+ oxidoreductase RnfD subunit
MKVLGHSVGRMYVSVIILLLFLAAASAYLLGQFPYALVLATLACPVIEVLIRKYYQKQKFRFPFSGIITGLIIGCVAPIAVPLLPILVACIAAVASKFFIKTKGANVFNPAAIGLLVLGVLSIGSSWWAATSVNVYGVAVSLAIVLLFAAYESRRLVLAFAFIIASVLLSIAASPPLILGNVAIAFIGVNYFFAFLMLTEPKTSPAKIAEQAVYGVYVAVVYFLLVALLPPSLYFSAIIIFVALLIGNLTYALYKKVGGLSGLSRQAVFTAGK